jgi:hypothetical protein
MRLVHLVALLGGSLWSACAPVVVVGAGGAGGAAAGGTDAGGAGGGGHGGQSKPPGCVPCSNLNTLEHYELDQACPGSLELMNAVAQCGCSHCPTCPDVCAYYKSLENNQCLNCFAKLDMEEVCAAEVEACMSDL